MVTRVGTEGPDRFDDGTEGDDRFEGLGGDDVFLVTDGNDTLDGGPGTDLAAYQWTFYPDGVFINNTDQLRNGVAPFTADKCGSGVDQLIGIEDLNGSDGPDIIYFWHTGAEIWAAPGDDLIVAPQRDERFPDNIIFPSSGADTIRGADEGDFLAYWHFEDSPESTPMRGVEVDLATGRAIDGWGDTDEFTGIAAAEGWNLDDRLFGTNGSNAFWGYGGNDLLEGRGGDDFLSGDDGRDTLNGGEGEEDQASYTFDPAGVLVDLRAGTATDGWGNPDTLISIEGVEGSDHDDRLFGTDGENFLEGEEGDDRLEGRGGGDGFEPGPGNDTIVGGASGNDPYLDNGDADYLYYRPASGGISVAFSSAGGGTVREDWTRTDTGETWLTTDTFTEIDVVVGTDFGDLFKGAAGRQWFVGAEGDDTFRGGDGADIVDFFSYEPNGIRVDLSAGTGTDGYGDTDTFLSIEEIRGTDQDDRIQGDAFANTLRGAGGDDTLIGGGGADSLIGGEGLDTAIFEGAAGDYIFDLATGEVIEKGEGASAGGIEGVERLEFSDGFSFGAEGQVDTTLLDGVADISAEELTTFVEMYIAYFDRAPDALGLFYWGTRLAEGMGLEEIAASFFVQDESLATFPDVNDNAALVDAAYANLLEREAEAEGRAYWIEQLELGNVSRPEFMLAIINGAKAETGSAADAKVVADKGRIGLDYAVINGLNDVGNANAAMQTYDRDDAAASLARAEALIDGYRDAAEAGEEIIVELAGVVDDPFASA